MTWSAAEGAVGASSQSFVVVGFLGFIVIALFLSVMGGPDGDSAADFHVGSRTLSPVKNGAALSGTYLATTVLLNVTGVVAISGFDGITMAVDLVLSLGVLILFARPLRQSGGHTLGDLFALRSSGTAPRIAAAVATLGVCVPFLAIQLNGAGAVTAQLMGLSTLGAKQVCTVLLGVLVVLCAALGGMRGLTLVQILSGGVTLAALAVSGLALLVHFHGDLDTLVSDAARGSGQQHYLQPGNLLGHTAEGRVDLLGLHLVLVLGTACMPHILLRVHAARDGAAARRSVRHTAIVVAVVCLALVLLGLGAAAVVGSEAIKNGDADGDAALLLITRSLLGGETTVLGDLLFTAVACAAFLTALSVIGGTTLAAASSVARDIYVHVVRRSPSAASTELAVARTASLVFGGLGVLIAVALQGSPTGFGSQLATSVAASAILPALVYSLYWPGYNRSGLLWTVFGGVVLAVLLPLFSPAMSGSPNSLLPDADFAWLPVRNPGLISIPAAFLLGWLGSRWGSSRTTPDDEKRRRQADALHLTGTQQPG
ncbi:hypothetical protein [Streptomyces sp. NPDC058614]|uniref:sodium:solute symporter family transporter n=1 Tax=Streptomyces sp. NPDC058614 TaxID=3346557 RepID=UPI0036589389